MTLPIIIIEKHTYQSIAGINNLAPGTATIYTGKRTDRRIFE
jgi:hypothetical protein